MDNKLELYQDLIIALLREYASTLPANAKEVENQVLIDRENNHFAFFRVGWSKNNFFHECLIHFDIKDEKIWLQSNWTDWDVAEELINRGVARKDIVLGFIPASERQYTAYAA